MAVHEHTPNAFHHVLDTGRWEFFDRLFSNPVEWRLPAFPLPWGGEFQVTKFMMLELIAAALFFIYQLWLIRARDREGCFRAFLNNNYVGMAVFIGLALEYQFNR